MATNGVSGGKILDITAGGAVESGSVQEVGADIVGVALNEASGSGVRYPLATEGIFEVDAKSSESHAVGDKLYWDSTAGTASKTYVAGAADCYLGVCVEAMTSASTTKVKLRGGAEAEVDLDDVVLKSLFDAHTVLAATSDNTPAAVTVGEDRIVGRIAGGNITALTAAQVRTIANVEDGADVTDATNVAAAGAVMDTDLAYYQATVASGGASVTVALATAGFVAAKPIFGNITNNTTNTVGIAKIYISGTDFVVVLSGDPGAGGAIVACWQDKR